MQRRTIHFAGHVQGVGFRYTAWEAASPLAVTGYVRNLPDGRVELVVEGAASEIETLLARLRERTEGHVKSAQESISAATGEFEGFQIRR